MLLFVLNQAAYKHADMKNNQNTLRNKKVLPHDWASSSIYTIFGYKSCDINIEIYGLEIYCPIQTHTWRTDLLLSTT